MLAHLARAKSYRDRATKCYSTANETTSASFEKCYRMLADHYILLADLEEDYVRRSAAMQLPGPQLLAQHHRTLRINPVNLKNMLRQI